MSPPENGLCDRLGLCCTSWNASRFKGSKVYLLSPLRDSTIHMYYIKGSKGSKVQRF